MTMFLHTALTSVIDTRAGLLLPQNLAQCACSRWKVKQCQRPCGECSQAKQTVVHQQWHNITSFELLFICIFIISIPVLRRLSIASYIAKLAFRVALQLHRQ